MARRVTMADVAAAAGVSLATVDRVVNGRQAVRGRTALAVRAAAERLGYRAAGALAAPPVAVLPVLRVGVVLHKRRQPFYRALEAALRAAVAAMPEVRARVEIVFAASQSPEEAAALMAEVGARADVVAATAVNHHRITEAVAALRRQGVPVLALLSDFAQGVRAGYVGLDNLQMGRLAGWMVATAARGAGPVAVFVGGHRWHGHDLREAGFRAFLRDAAPELRWLDTRVTLETRQVTYEATRDLLARQPDLRAIYVAGGGMEGAIAALSESRAPGRVVLVVNELTPESRAGLRAGQVTMAVATPLPALCAALTRRIGAIRTGGAGREQIFLQPDIHLPESL